jgi:hypothetical protein
MNWFRKWFRKWLNKDTNRLLGAALASPEVQSDHVQSGDFRIAVKNAINGKVLEISTYKPNPRGSDWTNELFVVPQGENLKDALTMLLLLKGLDK